MRGGTEGHNPEHRQRVAHEIRCGQGQRNTAKRSANGQLHSQNPESLRPQEIDKGAPKRFNHPRQIKPAGVKSNLSIGEPQLFIHDDADGHGDHIGDAFRQIDGRNPEPGVPIRIHSPAFVGGACPATAWVIGSSTYRHIRRMPASRMRGRLFLAVAVCF